MRIWLNCGQTLHETEIRTGEFYHPCSLYIVELLCGRDGKDCCGWQPFVAGRDWFVLEGGTGEGGMQEREELDRMAAWDPDSVALPPDSPQQST